MQTLDYQFGHDFGVGIDTVSGGIRGDAVLRGAPEEVTGAGGQDVVFAMEQVESTEQLSEALSASAEVNGRYGLFSASARFDFAQSTAVNSYSLYLLLSVVVTNSFRQLRDVRLSQDGVDLWSAGRPELWRSRYGDAFCAGMCTGGLYHAVLEIQTRDESEKQEIGAKLRAGYGAPGMGFDASAQFNHMVEEVSSTNSLKVSHFQSGGADSSVEITAANMINKAIEFPPSVAGDRAAPFSVLVKDYRTVSNLPAEPNRFDLRLAKDVVAECGRLRLNYLDWINDIDYILAHPGQFVWTNERKQSRELGKKADELREAITLLARQASRCADNVSECEMPTGDATVILEPEDIPERRRKPGGSRPMLVQAFHMRFPFFTAKPIKGLRGRWVRRNGKRVWKALGPARSDPRPQRQRMQALRQANGAMHLVPNGNAIEAALQHRMAAGG